MAFRLRVLICVAYVSCLYYVCEYGTHIFAFDYTFVSCIPLSLAVGLLPAMLTKLVFSVVQSTITYAVCIVLLYSVHDSFHIRRHFSPFDCVGSG